MAARSKPFCTIIGGPNGSGKSTIVAMLDLVGEFINADIAARRISPDAPERASFAAGKVVLRQLRDAVEARASFVYETTLSSNQSLALMSRCKSIGYEVALIFVTLENPDLNVRRVAERVAQGGHDIAEPVIRRRYRSSLARLPAAISMADDLLIFDNSGIEPQMLLSIEAGDITECRLDRTSHFHLGLGQAVAAGRHVDLSSILAAATYPSE